MSYIHYGVNNNPKVHCDKHHVFYPQGERCPWCEGWTCKYCRRNLANGEQCFDMFFTKQNGCTVRFYGVHARSRAAAVLYAIKEENQSEGFFRVDWFDEHGSIEVTRFRCENGFVYQVYQEF